MPTEQFVVVSEEAGERLDRLLARRAAIGRRRARELCERGLVTVDGRRVPAAHACSPDSVVAWEPLDERALPDPTLPLDVRLERADVVVVNKPAGQPSTPLRPGELGALANALVARYPEVGGVGRRAREPGLLHRLDTQTSGLLVACRTDTAFRILAAALSAGRLRKRYLAVVSGTELPDAGAIDAALAPDSRKRGRVGAGVSTRGYARASHTRYRVLARKGALVLVELEMERGFRHQIRAHLAGLGAPLVGDALYGGRAWPKHEGRHALHASYVAWAGDGTLAGFEVELDLPDDMRELFGA